MSKATKGLRRAGIGGLTAAVALGTLVASGGVASADSGFQFTRVAGANRFETAAKIANATYSNGSSTVILANGLAEHYPDALSANYLAGLLNVPVLLTDLNSTPSETSAALTKLGASKVIIIGGVNAVSANQAATLSQSYTVSRIAGADRYATNKKVVEDQGAGDVASFAGVKTAIITTGENFPDALGAGPLAFAKHFPVIVTNPTKLSDDAKAALSDLGVKQVLIVGGTAAVSAAVETEINNMGISTLQRFAGSTRSETSKLLATWEISQAGFTKSTFAVASGQQNLGGADALAGGVHSGKLMQPLLITDSSTVPGAVVTFASENKLTEQSGFIYGGPVAVSDTAATAIASAAGATNTTQSFTISPAGAQTKPESTTSAKEGQVAFTVTGLDNGAKYDLALFPAANVTTSGSAVVFKDSDGNANVADGLGTTKYGVAGITSVNNGVVEPASKDVQGITPVNGTITFTVDSAQADEAAAVLFESLSSGTTPTGNHVLDLNSQNQPTDKFVVSGPLTWNPVAASFSNASASGTAVSVNESANTITFDDATDDDSAPSVVYTYDSNDTFAVAGQGTGLSISQFEAALSNGDKLTVANYNTDASGVSSFAITDDVEPAPAAPMASVVNVDSGSYANDVQLSWTADADATPGTTYTPLAAPVTVGPDGKFGTSDDVVGTFVTAPDTDGSSTDTAATLKNVADGHYVFAVRAASPYTHTTATDSDASNLVAIAQPTSPVVDTTPPALQSALANDVNDSQGSTNVVRFVYNEAPTVIDATKFSVSSGDVTFTGVSATVSGNTVLVTVDGTLYDVSTDNAYTATAAAGAVKDAAGNATTSAASGDFSY